MKKMKKLLSVLLVAVMMVSLIPANVYATEAEAVEVTDDAVADEKVTADVKEESAEEAEAEAKAEAKEEAKAEAEAEAEAKEEALQKMEVEKKEKTGKTLNSAPRSGVTVESIEANDITLIEYVDGWWNEDWDDNDNYFEWFCYEYAPTFTATFSDGSVIESDTDGSLFYEDEWIWAEWYDDQWYDNQWEVGETYEVEASFMGFDFTFNVTIEENPIVSVEAEDITLVEGMDGWWADSWDENDDYIEWYQYDITPTFTAEFSDGQVLESYYGAIKYNGNKYEATWYDDQWYDNQWEVGNTYEVEASFLGIEFTYNVTIIDTLVESITANDITLMEMANGYYTEDWDENGNYVKWFCYEYAPTFTVTFKDGTVLESDTDGSVEYEGEWIWADWYDNQSYDNEWGVGTHEVEASFMGKEFTFNVIITEGPVESVAVDPVSLIENYDGWWAEDYNEETDEYDLEYYRYKYYPEFTVTLKDGTVLTSNDGYLIYDGEEYGLDCYDDQSYDNQWKAGNTYTVQALILGCDTEFQVTIEESPVASIEVNDIQIIENTCGYYDYGYNDETEEEFEFFYYEVGEAIDCTITMKDGTVLSNYGKPFVYLDDEKYYFEFSGDQYSDPWDLGKHNVTVSWYGAVTDIEVEIIECPYTSIEIIRTESLYENISGYYDWYWDDAIEDEVKYYTYDIPAFSYKLTKEDGSCIYGIYDEYAYNDEVNVSCDQYNDPWTVGGENLVTVTYGNLTTEFSAEIIPAESDFEYFEQDDEIYITGYFGNDTDVVIPEEINGKPVVGVLYIGDFVSIETITIPDSVVYISEDAFNYVEAHTIIIGSGVEYLSHSMFSTCYNLTTVTISVDNPYYCDIDGIVYDKDVTTLVVYPRELYWFGEAYHVPDTVTNIDVISVYPDLEVYFSEDSSHFVTKDDVVYTKDMKKIVRVNDISGKYVMPDTVEEILPGAFADSYKLNVVVISDKVTEIPEDAFYYCENLTTVELPEGLKSIGDDAFSECYDLTDINLPDGLESIGYSAFEFACFEEVTIPDSVEFLGAYAFAYNDSLSKVVVGKGITTIERCTFVDCYNLTDVNVRAEEVEVETSAFAYCPVDNFDTTKLTGSVGSHAFYRSNLKEADLSEGVTEIAYRAFDSCAALKTIDVPQSLNSLDSYAFDNTAWEKSQTDRAIYLEHAFYDYRNSDTLNDELTIKNGTTLIADYALEDSSNLVKLSLPEGLKTIGYAAIAGAKSLKEITIPASVTDIGEFVFAESTALEKITVASGNQYYSSKDGVLFNKDGSELIWCPKQSSGTYEIPESVEYVRQGAFGNSDLENIIIRNNDIELEYGSIGYNVWTNERYVLNMYCEEDSTAYYYAMDYLQNFIDLSELDTEIENPFTDIKETNYYYDAVLWAVGNGITAGKTDTEFAPTQACTRAQVVTFLWRSQGCPEPKTTTNPFVDVPNGKYYTKAVLWAFENGITSGKDATHFQPDVTVTRSQFVTFLWRLEGQPAPTITNPFVDVPNGKFYTNAVLWAFENGITSGKDATHFQPDASCQRCQVVTFLYRAYGN